MWQQRWRRRLEQRGRWRRLQFGRQQVRPGQEDGEGRAGLRRRRPRRQVLQRPRGRRPGRRRSRTSTSRPRNSPRSRARATRRRPSASRCWPSPATTPSWRSASRTPPRLSKVAPKFPQTHFAIVDDGGNCSSKARVAPGPAQRHLPAVHREREFLPGRRRGGAGRQDQATSASSAASTTPLIQKFQAGYVAGVHAINPNDQGRGRVHLAGPRLLRLQRPGQGQDDRRGQYDGGADVVYHAAGGSGSGLFQAAVEKDKLAIGVDSDQYQTAPAPRRSR